MISIRESLSKRQNTSVTRKKKELINVLEKLEKILEEFENSVWNIKKTLKNDVWLKKKVKNYKNVG